MKENIVPAIRETEERLRTIHRHLDRANKCVEVLEHIVDAELKQIRGLLGNVSVITEGITYELDEMQKRAPAHERVRLQDEGQR